MSDIELTSKQYNKASRAVKALNDVRKEVERENETDDNGITWYLASGGSLHLLNGLSHDKNEQKRPDRIIDTFYIDNADNGDW